MLAYVMFREKRLLDQGSDPVQGRFLFIEKLPDARGVDRAELVLYKVGMEDLVKARKGVGGGEGALNPARARLPEYGAAVRSSRRMSCPSAAPHQGLPQAPVQGCAVPREGVAGEISVLGIHLGVGTGSWRPVVHRPAGARAADPDPLANRGLQGIKRRNRHLKEPPQALTRVPGAQTCGNCTRAAQNRNHDYKHYAFSVCRVCKMGGHRANICP